MKTTVQSLFLALPFFLMPNAFAQHQTFTVNPDASKVAFSLGGNTHHVDGAFHVQRSSSTAVLQKLRALWLWLPAAATAATTAAIRR
jgi:hypothetical protein